jgi:hypothetical protein
VGRFVVEFCRFAHQLDRLMGYLELYRPQIRSEQGCDVAVTPDHKA